VLCSTAFPLKVHRVQGYAGGNTHVERSDLAGHGDTDQFISHTQYGVRDPFVLSTHDHDKGAGQVGLIQ
jgi:hypothetical protein